MSTVNMLAQQSEMCKHGDALGVRGLRPAISCTLSSVADASANSESASICEGMRCCAMATEIDIFLFGGQILVQTMADASAESKLPWNNISSAVLSVGEHVVVM